MIHLGDVAMDTITGFQGVAIARTEWLYGCRRITLQPQALHDGKPIDSHTFDEPQCVLVSSQPAVAPAVRTGGTRPEPVKR